MREKWYIRIWTEGKYLDFWSMIHLVDGMLLGGVALLVGLDFWWGFLVSFFVFFIWELVEPPEYFWNKILDVVVSSLGFLIFYIFFGVIDVWFYLVIFLAISLNFWGWIITKNYSKFFKNKI